MNSLLRYKGTIIGATLFVGLFFVYTQYIQGTPNDPLLISTESDGQPGEGIVAGQEIISILAEIDRIQLNTSLFADEDFSRLIDYRKDVESENVGRQNPFEPIGFGIDTDGVKAEPSPIDIQTINTD